MLNGPPLPGSPLNELEMIRLACELADAHGSSLVWVDESYLLPYIVYNLPTVTSPLTVSKRWTLAVRFRRRAEELESRMGPDMTVYSKYYDVFDCD